MPQIVVRQLSDEVHRALKARASEHGRSTEAEARDIIARAVLPDARPKAGDLLSTFGGGCVRSEIRTRQVRARADGGVVMPYF